MRQRSGGTRVRRRVRRTAGVATRIAVVLTACVAMLTTVASPSSAYSYPSNVVTACTSGYAFNGTKPIVFNANKQIIPCISDSVDVTVPLSINLVSQTVTVPGVPIPVSVTTVFELDTVLVHATTTGDCRDTFITGCIPEAVGDATAHQLVLKIDGVTIATLTGLYSHATAFDDGGGPCHVTNSYAFLNDNQQPSTHVDNVNLLGVNLGGGSPLPLNIPGGGTIRTNVITTQTAADGSSTFTDAAPVIVTLPGQAPIEIGASHVAMSCVMGN